MSEVGYLESSLRGQGICLYHQVRREFLGRLVLHDGARGVRQRGFTLRLGLLLHPDQKEDACLRQQLASAFLQRKSMH